MSSCCARKFYLELCASLAANKRIALREGVYTCETCASADKVRWLLNQQYAL